jgi:hypothetical protein
MNDSLERSERLHLRVRAFMHAALAARSHESFDELACAIARHQAGEVEAMARLFAARGMSTSALAAASDIPALPADAFRLRRIAVHPASVDERCFATSGTSDVQRGRHPMRTTATYAAAALAWAQTMLWPDKGPDRGGTGRLRLVALTQSEAQAPESSLSFMLARFAEELGGGASWHWDGTALDVAGVRAACSAAAEPLLVTGTAFAFVHLCDALGSDRLALPAASRVMQTGGFKGRTHAIEPDELVERIAHAFDLPAERIVGEYGMTELSSQLYQGGVRRALGLPTPEDPRRYHPPPWLRVTAVDPLGLEPVAPGAVGLARFVDLANVDSAVAVQTSDQVRVAADGSVELLGRAPGATPRGCSLALEALLG